MARKSQTENEYAGCGATRGKRSYSEKDGKESIRRMEGTKAASVRQLNMRNDKNRNKHLSVMQHTDNKMLPAFKFKK